MSSREDDELELIEIARKASHLKENKEAARKKLDAINKTLQGELETLHVLLVFLTKLIPGFAGLLGGADGTLSTINRLLISINGATKAMNKAGSGLSFASLAMEAVKFIVIPISYGIAWYLTGKRPPITFTTLGKVVNIAVGVGLTLTAIFVPVTGPFIAIALAGIAFTIATGSLINMKRQEYALKKTLKSFQSGEMKRNLDAAQEAFELQFEEAQYQSQVLKLQERLDAVTTDAEYEQVAREINALQEAYNEAKAPYQNLLNQKAEAEQEYKAINSLAYLDKAAGITFSALALTGLAVAIFFPYVGLIMALTALGVGTIYGFSRLAQNLLGKNESKTASHMPESTELKDDPGARNSLTPDAILSNVSKSHTEQLSSMNVLASGLSANLGASVRKLHENNELIDHLNKMLNQTIAAPENGHRALDFYKEVQKNLQIQVPEMNAQEIEAFLDVFDNHDKGLALLRSELKVLAMSSETTTMALDYPPLLDALGINDLLVPQPTPNSNTLPQEAPHYDDDLEPKSPHMEH